MRKDNTIKIRKLYRISLVSRNLIKIPTYKIINRLWQIELQQALFHREEIKKDKKLWSINIILRFSVSTFFCHLISIKLFMITHFF